MSDEPKEPEGQADDSTQPDEEEGPKLREVSKDALEAILKEHKKWLESEGNEGKQADLRRANLQEVSLFRANLQKANLNKANLQKADLIQANLQEAVLSEANLQEVSLFRANLQKANLNKANLQKANLNKANLQKANLNKANLQEAVLSEANLQEASLYQTNLQKANLIQANLQKANLIEANLQKADLFQANLQKAILITANLKDANLGQVKGLEKAKLRDINLEGATGLLGSEFAGMDIIGAQLPKDIANFKALDHVTEISKHARNIFLAVIGGCVFSWLTIATTTDVALLTNAASTPLPIIQTRVPIAGFYWAASAILLSLYIYLHLYLQRLWEGMASLPAIFPDGRTLDERAYPWLLSGLVRAHVPQLKDKPQARLGLQVIVSIVTAWMLVPATLGLFWLRYLPRHDWPWTLWLVVLFVVAVTFGIASYRLATSTLRGESWEPIVWRTANKNTRVYTWSAVFTAMMILIFSLSFNAIEGVPAPFLMATADLRKVNLPRADLAGRDLKGANFRFAGLQEADLRTTNLQEADLGWVNLRNADLGRAQLHMTFFDGARLQEANLRGATGLTSAQLDKACGDEKTKLPDYLKDYKIKLCPEDLK